jgi:hypothetical protein
MTSHRPHERDTAADGHGPVVVDGFAATPPPQPSPMAAQDIAYWTPALMVAAILRLSYRALRSMITPRIGHTDHA